MLPAELVDVRLVPGVDATVRSLAGAVGVVMLLSAMAGGWRCLCSLHCLLPRPSSTVRGAIQLYRLVRGDLLSLDLREPLRWLHVRRRRHLVSEPRACVRASVRADKC